MRFDQVMMGIVIILTMVFLLYLIFNTDYSHGTLSPDKLCQQCNFHKATDEKYLLPAGVGELDKIECDNKAVLNVSYPKYTDKWGTEHFNWTSPEVAC